MTSNTPELHAITERMRKLEAQNRRLQRIGILALGILGTVVLMGQAAPKTRVIEAERFVLRDSAGTIRAELAANEETTSFLLSDVQGQPRAALSVIPKGPILLLRDEPRSKRWVTLDLFDDGSGLELKGLDGEYRAVLRLVQNNPSLTFFGSDKTPHVGLGLSLRSPNLLLSGPGNKGNVSLSVDPENGPGITLQGMDGKIVWTAPASSVPAESRAYPRVFIESWSQAHPFKPALNEKPSEEQAAFGSTCRTAVVTIERQRADYVLRLEHHLPGGSFLRPGDPPSDYGLDFHGYQVFDHEGVQLAADSHLTLGDALGEACKVISTDASRRGR